MLGTQEQKTVGTIILGAGAWHDQPINRIESLWPPVKLSKAKSEVLQVTWALWLPGHGLLSHQNSILKHYMSPLQASLGLGLGCLTSQLRRLSRRILESLPARPKFGRLTVSIYIREGNCIANPARLFFCILSSCE